MILSSLRIRLFLWLLVPLGTFVIVTGVFSLHQTQAMANLLQDDELLSSMRIIGEDIDWDDTGVVVQIPPAALELFQSQSLDSVFYKVVDPRGRLLAGKPDLPVVDNVSSSPVFYLTRMNDGPVLRAVAYTRALYDSGQVENVTVVVARTQGARDQMVYRLWYPALLRAVVMMGLAMLLVLLALTVELRPLIKLKEALTDRDPLQLRPIRAEWLHHELRPIVDAINHCISQLGQHAHTQRRFISDAAHQLRTPLTLLDTQIQFAQKRNVADGAVVAALAGMEKSSRRMAMLTGKLLLLAQAESAMPAHQGDVVDLSAVIQAVLEDLVEFAQQRQIDLGVELDSTFHVRGADVMISAMLTNLVDNALRYTQPGGRVTVAASCIGDEVVLQVIDNGPGIPAESRPRVFERFFRASTGTEGSGLGLSIVREIVQRYGGSVSLAPGPRGIGLVVSVRLRLWPTDGAKNNEIVTGGG